VSEHAVIKTLLFQESEDAVPFIVLQHGDASVDTKKLIKEIARTKGMTSGMAGEGVDSCLNREKRSRVFMTSPETAQQYTGYQVGGTSPFGIQDPSLRIFMEASLLKIVPAPQPETVAPTKPEDAELRARQVEAWDTQIATQSSLVDFTHLSTRLAKDSTLDLITPAWVLINGGARGTLVALSVRELVKLLRPIIVTVAKASGGEKEDGGKQAQEKKKAIPADAAAASP
jgi:prolyl-tRNA editing enzyme YbaK/EbsC (Cys-tRNA(Pro) deacylase)